MSNDHGDTWLRCENSIGNSMDSGNPSFPNWVLEAATRPIAFAQVREDPLIDEWSLKQAKEKARVIMVASGGCTAAALAATGRLAHLQLVDPSPAQMALARLKLHLLATRTPHYRLALLGHSHMETRARMQRLHDELAKLDLSAGILGADEALAEFGPDYSGRYELLFAALRDTLKHQADELETLLRLDDPQAQAVLVSPETELGSALDSSFQQVMSQEILVRLFGPDATHNRVESFASHFANRTRDVLARLSAVKNPFLWQVLRGNYPCQVVAPWLMAPPPATMPSLVTSVCPMADALADARGEFDIVHLSNILDWLTADSARETLQRAWDALRPGGYVVIRQLNSTLDIQKLGDRFDWDTASAARLHAGDRSYFYRALHLGTKEC